MIHSYCFVSVTGQRSITRVWSDRMPENAIEDAGYLLLGESITHIGSVTYADYMNGRLERVEADALAGRLDLRVRMTRKRVRA